MEKQSLGNIILNLRKERGMTQVDLANLMGVTDKAVSKWERDLSYPDISSLPKLAEIFNISIDQLMQIDINNEKDKTENKKDIKNLINLVLKAIILAMGVSVTVLCVINKIDIKSAITMIGIAIVCNGIIMLGSSK